MSGNVKRVEKSVFGQILKGLLFGLLFILIAVLLFALIIQFTDLSSKLIRPINQVIKVLGVIVACLVSICEKGKGWFVGSLTGGLLAFVSFLIFSLISGEFLFDRTLLIDLIVGVVIGFLVGIFLKAIRK